MGMALASEFTSNHLDLPFESISQQTGYPFESSLDRILPKSYPLCSLETETVDHVLRKCFFARRFWKRLHHFSAAEEFFHGTGQWKIEWKGIYPKQINISSLLKSTHQQSLSLIHLGAWSKPMCLSFIRWYPLPPNSIKINVDGSLIAPSSGGIKQLAAMLHKATVHEKKIYLKILQMDSLCGMEGALFN